MEKNLGHATAYGYAKSKGYTGTEEEFGVLMASYASVAQDASNSASNAAEAAQLASQLEAMAKRHAQDAEVDANRAEMAAHAAGFFWLETDANDDLIFIRTDNAPVNIYTDENDDLVMEVY